MGPGVDGLEAVGVGGNYENFAAIRLEKHLRGSASELEIGEENGASEIDDGETVVRVAHDEGQSGIGDNDDFVGLRDDGNGVEELEGTCVVDAEGVGATIDDDDILCVRSETGLHGFGICVSAAVDLARGGVDGDELVGAGGGGVQAIAVGGKIKRVGRGADGDARELVGVRVEDEDEAASGGDAPDFVAGGVFAKVGDGWADGNFGDGLEFGEIDYGEGAVGGGDVGVHVEIGAEEGRAVFMEEDNDAGDEEDDESKIEAEVFGMGHEWKEEDIRYR